MECISSQNLETNNRKLLELFGASRLAENVRENCDLSDLTFSTLLNNIAYSIYTDVSNVNLPPTDNGITLLILICALSSMKKTSISSKNSLKLYHAFRTSCVYRKHGLKETH